MENFKINPLLLTDGYKSAHHYLYPEKTTMVYSNLTPRSVKRMPEKAKEIVVFGNQFTFMSLHNIFKENFFDLKKENILKELNDFYSSYIGRDYDVSHFEKLHDLGYLPIHVKGLEEGTIVGAKIPVFTIVNTLPEFYWVTNFLETIISCLAWKPIHSASMAYSFRKISQKYALDTDKENIGFIDFQMHDFSMRGMQHYESAISSGMGFLTCFKGTDTVPAIKASEYYYGEKNAGFSVIASEHSVMTIYGQENELSSLEHLLDTNTEGILSLVLDSWDFWNNISVNLPKLEDKIMSRNGKLVVRHDSAEDPVDAICGIDIKETLEMENLYYDPRMELTESEKNSKGEYSNFYSNKKESFMKRYKEIEIKGIVECLWDIFGGTINEQGYKVLDPHIGCIYGDSITLERAEEICKRLKEKGFASTNVVMGVGSYSLGYASRDSQGVAIKCTAAIVDGEFKEVFKDPAGVDKEKKSAKGLLMVYRDNDGIIKMKDQCTEEEEKKGLLKTIYKDGIFYNTTTLEKIRSIILETIK